MTRSPTHIRETSGGRNGNAFLATRSDDPEEWRAALETIQESCQDLADLTRAFTNLLKRRDVVSSSRFSLSHVAEQVGRLIRPLARERSVEFETLVLTDGEVEGEVRLAIQAVLNLATNAVRACSAGSGLVELQVRRKSRKLGRIQVRDNGCGIPEDVRRSLFRPLLTGGSAREGHGLGLFVVRQAVRRLNGCIRLFTSQEGTTFNLDVPLV